MANNNRTEVSAAIQALDALVGETKYKQLVNDVFAKSVVFRKDVSTTDTAATATKTLDFTDIDFITVTQSTNVTYTLSGIQQGEIKYLKITKSAGQSIAFSGATQEDENSTYIQALTSIMYEIFNKDGSIQVRAISKTIPSASETYKGIVEFANATEAADYSNFSMAVAPARMPEAMSTLFSSWVDASYNSGSFSNWSVSSGGFKVRYLKIGDTVFFSFYCTGTITGGQDTLTYNVPAAITGSIDQRFALSIIAKQSGSIDSDFTAEFMDEDVIIETGAIKSGEWVIAINGIWEGSLQE